MNEMEKRSFRIVFEWYNHWRNTIIETDEQWEEFANSVGELARDIDAEHCILGTHLMLAVIDTINDLYKDGNKPLPNNYFGREDLP